MESQWAAQRMSGTPFISLQPQYSLVARAIEAEILPVCRRHGLGTLIWSPLGGGVLAGRYRPGAAPAPETRVGRMRTSPYPNARAWADGMLNDAAMDVAAEVAKVAAELGATPAAVALAWLWRRPGVTSVIIGPRTADQLRGNLDALALDLPDELAARLDEVSRATVGEPVTGMTHRP